MKRFASGFAAGLLVAGAALLALRARRAPAESPRGAVPARAAAGNDAALLADLEDARRENAALRSASAPPASVVPSSGTRRPGGRADFTAVVKALGAKFAALRDKLKDADFADTAEGQALEVEVSARLQELVEQTGLRPEEVLRSPEFYWPLEMEFLAGGEPPLSAEQIERMRARLDAARPGWEAYIAARDGMTRLEQAREMRHIETDLESAMYEIMDDAQMDSVDRLTGELPWFWPIAPSAGTVFPTREDAVASLRDEWARDLGFEPADAAALEPAVREFMRRTDEFRASFASKQARGEDLPDWSLAQFDVMVETQRWIAQSIALNDAQKRALRDWAKTYTYQVAPAPGGK